MHKYIEATYKLYTEADNGLQLVEETQEGQPLRLYTGMGMTMDAYEKGIETFSEGEDYEFVVAKENAYGDYHDDMVIDIPRTEHFPNGEVDSSQVYAGATLPLQNEDGHRFLARVEKIDDTNVRVNLNHPLAGKDLTFRGHVIVSREVSDEEIEELKKKLNHHHCGSGGCCGGGCGDGDHCGDGSCGEGNCGENGHCGGCGGCC